jgi:hypothetical protein
MNKYAIYFPQFHQVKVNDAAWGAGFTDWCLVATANALAKWGRRAPRCGFYDLSDQQSVAHQFQQAADYGLQGFGIYHYWFKDGPELSAVENYLRDANLPENFSFFFIWANESWSKRWAGKHDVLLKEVHTAPTAEEVQRHVRYLAPFLTKKSHTHCRGRPLFVIYRPEFFSEVAQTVELYRQEFNRAGLDPEIGFFLKSESDLSYGRFFDFCYLFEPRLFFNFHGLGGNPRFTAVYRLLLRYLNYGSVEKIAERTRAVLLGKTRRYAFDAFLDYFASERRNNLLRRLECPTQNILTAGWNNVPRYGDRFTELSAPEIFQFTEMVKLAENNQAVCHDIPLLCNAWNEWSEGAALEPCVYLGDGFLKSYVAVE